MSYPYQTSKQERECLERYQKEQEIIKLKQESLRLRQRFLERLDEQLHEDAQRCRDHLSSFDASSNIDLKELSLHGQSAIANSLSQFELELVCRQTELIKEKQSLNGEYEQKAHKFKQELASFDTTKDQAKALVGQATI